MKNIEFDAFVTSILRLVETMVIKIERVALRDNLIQERAGYSVSSDKNTWRYYMNLNGDYHPTDQPMYVKSSDTGDMILFNKANLQIHLVTYREYLSGGALLQRLNSQYPGQSQLIRGILAPIPYSETVSAEDYKILKYNESLVLWNEDQLIPQIQEWINVEAKLLLSNDYLITEDLMLPLAIIQLNADLMKAIGTIRFEAIGTRHVHDFFIWARIDSYGDFSRYKNSLNRFQTMWLYRNIPWIMNNPGQQYTFGKLMQNLLTVADIPLAKFDMVETTETQLEDLTPVPLYRRLQLNLQENYGRAAAFIDTEELIAKQSVVAKDNVPNQTIWEADALKKGKYSLHSELPTKTLESKMSDYTNRHLDTLMSTVYNEWIYLAGKGIYKGKILVVDPKNGKSVRLPVGDAYYIWRYLLDLTYGETPTYICPAQYSNVMKLKPPSIDELFQIGGKAFINSETANGIRNQWIPADPFISAEYLITYAKGVYDAQWNHRKIFSQYYDLNMRARVKNTTAAMYETGYVTGLTTFTAYRDLLAAYELNFSDYTADEARNFAWDIFKRITGWDTNAQPSLRAKQADLIDMMAKLSSYTIQFVKEMDDGVETTELKNETFVGDPKWIGKGNGSYGDFKNAQLGSHGHMDGIRFNTALIPLINEDVLVPISEGMGCGTIVTGDYFKAVDLDPRLRSHAVRMADTSYFRSLNLKDIPKDGVEDIVPDTYYGQLEFPYGYYDRVPDTYYGVLQFPIESIRRIPDAFYGTMELKENVTVRIPITYYGRLPLSRWYIIPPTDYNPIDKK